MSFSVNSINSSLLNILTSSTDQLQKSRLRIASGAKINSEELPRLNGDVGQLTQLFQNLIGNAIKFCGKTPPEVTVSATRKDTEWIISVVDNGIGIAPQYQDQIFGMFKRLHGRNEYEGTGIGLAVCNKIVERHGGRIWVESEAGKGAAFHFTTPVIAINAEN